MSEDIQVSKLEGLELAEYVLEKKSNCELYHKDCRQGCEQMVYAEKIVLDGALPILWRRVFPHVQYDCEKAQCRILQMPVACMRFKQGCFVVEKTMDGLYEDKKGNLGKINLVEITRGQRCAYGKFTRGIYCPS